MIDERERNTAMSTYVTDGTLGVACEPLVGAVILWSLDLNGNGAVTFLLAWFLPTENRIRELRGE